MHKTWRSSKVKRRQTIYAEKIMRLFGHILGGTLLGLLHFYLDITRL